MYFKKHSQIEYPVKHYRKKVQNILTSIHPKDVDLDHHLLYLNHIVQDGERAELVSYKYYSDAKYYWTLYVINNIINPYHDWPMSQIELDEYVKRKYHRPMQIKHFIDLRTNQIMDEVDEEIVHNYFENEGSYPFYASPVTHYQYENEKNIANKDIMVLNPLYLQKFIKKYHEELRTR